MTMPNPPREITDENPGVVDAEIARIQRHGHKTLADLCDEIDSLTAKLAAISETVRFTDLLDYVHCRQTVERIAAILAEEKPS